MKTLITGASGLLGSYLLKTIPQGIEAYSKRFDILSKDDTYAAFDEAKPDVVIHCAGEGRVDFAQENRCQAWRLNLEGTENILRACRYWGARLVYISSNAIYNGFNPPYGEYSACHPINQYGATKLATEQMLVNQFMVDTTTIRPILLYGWPQPDKRDNFVTRLLADLNMGMDVKVADDIISQPTYAKDCAEAIWRSVEMLKNQKECLNIAPKEKMSLFKFAVEVAKAFDLDPARITPVHSSEFKGLAPRPIDTTYDTITLEKLGISLRNPAEGLRAMRAEKE